MLLGPFEVRDGEGRRVEISGARLCALVARLALETGRLVTVVGPGGAGKTRLAAEVAERSADLAPDGVWLAELAPVTDPHDVANAVLTAIGGRDGARFEAGAGGAARAGHQPGVAGRGGREPLSRPAPGVARRRDGGRPRLLRGPPLRRPSRGGTPRLHPRRDHHRGRRVRAALGDEAFAAAYESGAALTRDAAISAVRPA
jgi:hypothetical protein